MTAGLGGTQRDERALRRERRRANRDPVCVSAAAQARRCVSPNRSRLARSRSRTCPSCPEQITIGAGGQSRENPGEAGRGLASGHERRARFRTPEPKTKNARTRFQAPNPRTRTHARRFQAPKPKTRTCPTCPSPIERCWGFVKHQLRKLSARTAGKLRAGIRRAFRRVCPRHLVGWFARCGYLNPSDLRCKAMQFSS